jgi:dTDP-3-amino-3,4,6-trideoxy-alpha-D-glucose transaminase
VSSRAVPFIDLRPGDDAAEVRAAIERVVSRGWFILGPEVEAFEAEFAAASGARHAVGVATGTDAIALLLRAAGVGAGDEVLVPAMTAAYTGLAVTALGARPVFVDIDAARATMDPEACEASITPRTRAMVPVHLYGQAAAMPQLRDVASRHRLALVEDCCQAHLAACEGTPVGTFGIGGAFSFYPTKNLGALGDGGAVITNDASIADRIRRLRNGGQSDRYHHVEAGINSRLDEMQAAVLRARLPRLHELTARRRALAASYRRQLPDSVRAVPELDAGHVYHLFAVRSPERDRLQAHLRAAGIETLIHYPVALPDQEAFSSFNPAHCRAAVLLAGEVLSLPLHPRLGEDDLSRVCEAAGAFQKGRVLA